MRPYGIALGIRSRCKVERRRWPKAPPLVGLQEQPGSWNLSYIADTGTSAPGTRYDETPTSGGTPSLCTCSCSRTARNSVALNSSPAPNGFPESPVPPELVSWRFAHCAVPSLGRLMHEPGYVLNSVDHRNDFTALMAEHREVHGNPIFLEPRSLFRHLITHVVFLNVQSVWATTARYTRQGPIQIADAVYFWLAGINRGNTSKT